MIKVLSYYNIEDILNNIHDYVDDTQDLVLVRINGVMVMIGMDEDDKIYFVIEDDEVSEDRYINDFYPAMTLQEAYESIIKELTESED